MGQRQVPRSAAVFFALLAFCLLGPVASGCRKQTTPAPTQSAKSPTIASLVPAATDLLVGMGAGDHLLAVSNWDRDTNAVKGLPRVGDYQTIDWEKLAQLRPQFMITQFGSDRLPAGLSDKANRFGIKLMNVQIERVQDVLMMIESLGNAVNEPAKAAAAQRRLRDQLTGVSHRVQGLPRVPALIVIDDQGEAVIGSDTFLDDLLRIAGGTNVVASMRRYPSIDREQLLKFAPEVVIQILPDAAPNVLAQANTFWQSVPDVPAVKNHRVYPITDGSALLPGLAIGDLAEKFADLLHPRAPTTQSGANP
jgi:iron complex transport system substrate-binding protein